MNKKVILNPGKDKAIRNRHHWIFSGAVASLPSFADGEFLPVHAHDGALLGSAYFNRQSGIVGRMVSFDATPPLTAIEKNVDEAIALRKQLFPDNKTTAYRLINGEGDGIPGLIVDRYDQVLVIQIGTLGIEKIKTWLVDLLQKKLAPTSIYEKSLLPTRREEGLKDVQGQLFGNFIPEVEVRENGHAFIVSLEKSQKTGFFLDHREMRAWVGSIAANKRVLNAFSYTGGFSVYALAGGAKSADSLDISEEALALAKRNIALNGLQDKAAGFYPADVFQYLRDRKELPYDLVILDPPAFAKKKKDVVTACRGYKDINRLAMQKMPAGSFLLTCSCSHHVDETLFQQVVFQAAAEAKRNVRIIGKQRLAPDHPINIFHPESAYLKSLCLYIS